MTSHHEKRRPRGKSWSPSLFVNLYHQKRHATDSDPIYATSTGSVQVLRQLGGGGKCAIIT